MFECCGQGLDFHVFLRFRETPKSGSNTTPADEFVTPPSAEKAARRTQRGTSDTSLPQTLTLWDGDPNETNHFVANRNSLSVTLHYIT